MSTKSALGDHQVVYLIHTKAGGIDGTTNEPSKVVYATFNKKEAESKLTGYHFATVEAIDLTDVRLKLLARLSPVEKLALGCNGAVPGGPSVVVRPDDVPPAVKLSDFDL